MIVTRSFRHTIINLWVSDPNRDFIKLVVCWAIWLTDVISSLLHTMCNRVETCGIHIEDLRKT